MRISREHLAQMLVDGSIVGKTVVSKSSNDRFPVTFFFEDMYFNNKIKLRYRLTNPNLKPPCKNYPTWFYSEEFAKFLLKEDFDWIELGYPKPRWRV